jgi:hypothetical protein
MTLALVIVSATTAGAQSAPAWERGTGIAAAAGVTHADGSGTHGTVGGSVLWELTTHFALEGAARWMHHGPASNGYAGELAALVGLGGRRDTAVPYLTVGVGFQRRNFDLAAGAPVDDVPAFYRRRLGASGAGVGGRRSFADPTLVAGAGVDIALSRNVVLRPDVRVLFAVDGGRHATTTVAVVNLGYRFEHRPVTPARR